MKKVSLLVLLAIVASTLLMAAIPTTVVRLTIINKSGYDVYMKLEGSKITEAYYYLTVPSGTRDEPYVKVFTVMSDLYTRTTWQCGGVQSSGTLIVDGNIRLTFTPCGEKACSWTGAYYSFKKCGGDVAAAWLDYLDKNPGANFKDWWQNGGYKFGDYWEVGHRYAGEPRMEKVTYFKYLQIYPHVGDLGWNSAYLANGWFNFGCGTWVWRIRSYRLPYGCAWRYQY
jgi:hypothetical protein